MWITLLRSDMVHILEGWHRMRSLLSIGSVLGVFRYWIGIRIRGGCDLYWYDDYNVPEMEETLVNTTVTFHHERSTDIIDRPPNCITLLSRVIGRREREKATGACRKLVSSHVCLPCVIAYGDSTWLSTRWILISNVLRLKRHYNNAR